MRRGETPSDEPVMLSREAWGCIIARIERHDDGVGCSIADDIRDQLGVGRGIPPAL